MIKLQQISKSFSNTQALKSINLTIETGETTVLIGPSGCGKSTLLRLIIGLIQIDSGKILFEETEINLETVLSLRKKMGYVIQEGGLFPHLSVSQNVTLMANYLGWKKEKVKNRLNKLLEITQLPDNLLERFPAQLSGGQRQRVSLMRALMLDPDVLLLDEPLGALDPMIRADLQTDLKKIFQKLKKTVVMVTHDIGEAGYFGDTIVLMNEGGIVQTGSLNDLVYLPTDPFVTKFINAQRSPLENLKGGSE
jgi:osmoprotectant transport system ATP-binding protein